MSAIKFERLQSAFLKALDASINSMGEDELQECFGELKTQLGGNLQMAFVNMISRSEKKIENEFRRISARYKVVDILTSSCPSLSSATKQIEAQHSSEGTASQWVEVQMAIKHAEMEELDRQIALLETETKRAADLVSRLKTQLYNEIEALNEQSVKLERFQFAARNNNRFAPQSQHRGAKLDGKSEYHCNSWKLSLHHGPSALSIFSLGNMRVVLTFFSFRLPPSSSSNSAHWTKRSRQIRRASRPLQKITASVDKSSGGRWDGRVAVHKKVVVEVVASQRAEGSHGEAAHGDEREETSESSFEGGPVEQEVQRSWYQLRKSLQGAKLDSLIMLMATSAVIPLFKKLNTSPIVGFLLTGTLIGPQGLNWVKDLHTIDSLGELGIVFFLFEMGLELSLERLKAMRRDVFGLGTSQFLLTTASITLAGMAFGLSLPAAVTVGGSLALSSSAFVLQLLKDKNAMGTRHGKGSFGILLLQDLAVVPLLVVVQLLAKGGAGLGRALSVAGVKALITLSAMSFLGQRLLNPIFSVVARASSHEAFLSIIMATVLLMSFVTKGIGLSDTLGAFLAGLLLSETSYRYQIESDIAPFRGLLLGLFFITVGFSIDMRLFLQRPLHVVGALLALIGCKAGIITALSSAFGMPLGSAIQTGLLNSQGGEFAFVSLGIAQRMGLLSESLCKLLLTTVALSMALTPALADMAASLAKKVEDNLGFAYYAGQDKGATQVKADLAKNDFVFVCGYGEVGKMVCGLLDRKFIKYIVLENSPQKAIEARNKGLPVFFGDIHRPEVLKHFHLGDAKACVLTLEDMSATNKAVIRLRKLYPDLPMIVRARNAQHQKRLENMFDNILPIIPALPEDSVLLSLPLGEAVLEQIGVARPEIDAMLEDIRRVHEDEDEDDLKAQEASKDDATSDHAQHKKPLLPLFKTRRAVTPAEDSTSEVIDTERHDEISKQIEQLMASRQQQQQQQHGQIESSIVQVEVQELEAPTSPIPLPRSFQAPQVIDEQL
eukprot:scaffold1618_cov158-Ochromonas_danica.AAC.19